MWFCICSGSWFEETFENKQWRKTKQVQPVWLCINSGTRFEDTFDNTQWRKVEPMQPVWICIISGRWFEDTFENTWWRKAKQMQPMWLCLLSGRQFEDTFKKAQSRKVKQMQPVWLCILLCNKCDANAYASANASSYAINVIIHHLWQTVSGGIWKHTVEKSPTNVHEDFWTKSHCCDVWELFKFLDNKIISNEWR